MANDTKAQSYGRIGDYDRTFGYSLEVIEGTEVLIHDYSIGERELTRDGETAKRTFVTIEASTEPDGPTKTYHAWSDSVAEKLASIAKENLPLMGTFRKVTTGSGRQVWDVQ